MYHTLEAPGVEVFFAGQHLEVFKRCLLCLFYQCALYVQGKVFNPRGILYRVRGVVALPVTGK